MTLGEAITLFIAIFGVAGIIFTALRYNRDDTTAIVNQQSTLVRDMQAVNEELRVRVKELQTEVDRLTRLMREHSS